MKVVINRCYGGFGLSEAAYEKLIEWGIPVRQFADVKDGESSDGVILQDGVPGVKYWDTWLGDQRHHELLVRVVEELGPASYGECAKLAVIEIPDGIKYEVSDYDGYEHIAEMHRTWS